MKIFLIGKYPEKRNTDEYTKFWLHTMQQKEKNFFYKKLFFKEEPWKTILKIPYLSWLLLIKKPDILHAQYYAEAVGPCFPILLLAAKLRPKLKTILLVHEKPDFLLNHLPNIIKPLYLLFEKITFSLTDHLIVHTHEAKESIMKYYHIKNKKISVLPFPWPEAIEIIEEKTVLKEKNKINEKLIFTIFGRVVPKKGIDIVLPLIKKLRMESRDVGLIIAGPVPKNHQKYFASIKNLIKELSLEEHIHIFDLLSTRQMSEIYKITDISLFAYRSVTQSAVFYTSLAHEAPVLAFAWPGFSEFMNKHPIGYLVPANNELKLLEVMKKAMDNPQQLIEFRKNINSIRNDYSWDKTVEKYQHIYETI